MIDCLLFLSSHNLDLLFCCVLSILALIWLVLMALFCAAIRRVSVSPLRFSFISHIFSSEMLLISRLKRPQSCFSLKTSIICIITVILLVVCFFTRDITGCTSLKSEWQQVFFNSWTFLSIQDDFSSALVLMALNLPSIFNYIFVFMVFGDHSKDSNEN